MLLTIRYVSARYIKRIVPYLGSAGLDRGRELCLSWCTKGLADVRDDRDSLGDPF